MTRTSFKTLSGETRARVKRKGSRFIGVGNNCEDQKELDCLRNELSEEFPKATHITSASVMVEDGRPVERYDNDGEPSGTAGEPILQVIKGKGLLNCVVFVVRYFGGTELGTGGLSRAYSDTAKRVIESGKIIKKIERDRYRISFPYSFTGKVAQLLAEFEDITVLKRDYGEEPKLYLSVPVADEDVFTDKLKALTSGSVKIKGEDDLSQGE